MAYKIPSKKSRERVDYKGEMLIDTFVNGNISEARKEYKRLSSKNKFIVNEMAKQTLTEPTYSKFKRLIIFD
jgi:hypothetical protein